MPKTSSLLRRYWSFIFFSVLATAFSWLINHAEKRSPLTFPDSIDYKIQSGFSLLSKDFYAPKPNKWFSPRPFTVPLCTKLSGTEPNDIVSFQRGFYCFCVIVFCAALFVHISNPTLRILASISIFFFFTWWNIVGWTDTVLSESISMSFLFLWMGIFLFYLKFNRWDIFALFCVVTVLFSFTRDSWPYIIVAFAVLNLLFFSLKKRSLWKKNGIFLGLALCVLFLQSRTADIGNRSKLPVFNIIAGRISKSPDYLQWFTSRGMPQADKIRSDFGKINIDSDKGRSSIYAAYSDSSYYPLFSWILQNGKSTYQSFLLTHPGYFFLQDLPSDQWQTFNAINLKHYTYKPLGFFANADNVFPLLTIWILIGLSFLAIITFRLRKHVTLLLPPLFLLLLAGNALISFNADCLEVERHVFITQIWIDLSGILSLFILTDFWVQWYRLKTKSTEETKAYPHELIL